MSKGSNIYEHLINKNYLNQFNFNQIEQQNYLIKKISKLYWIIKGVNFRKKFSLLKIQLEIKTEKLKEKINNNFNYFLIQKAEDERKIIFNKEGWTKYYDKTNKKIKINYGKIVLTKLLINDNDYYTGFVNLNNEKHGFGKCIKKDGTKYEGYWLNNKENGWGDLIDKNGNILQGLFKDGKLNGKGFKFYSNGNFYEGDFVESYKHGKGTEETHEHVYKGTFMNDKKNLKGTLTYKSMNDTYTGKFKDNKITGKGEYVWANKDVYVGDFIDGKMHGKGTYKWPDGGEYTGDYVDNIKSGIGKFKWPNGKLFVGPFVNGKPHGKGILTSNEGKTEAEFVDGKILKTPKLS